jgi:hypothetical protein
VFVARITLVHRRSTAMLVTVANQGAEATDSRERTAYAGGQRLGGLGRWLHRRPVLLVGVPRTGTSWTAKGLSQGGGVRYLREPMQSLPQALKDRLRFRYLTAGDDDPEYAAAWRGFLSVRGLLSKRWTLGESRPRRRLPLWPARLLIKEVYCPLALEWLARHLGAQVVVTIRHPCGFVASALRLEQLGHPTIPLPKLLDQPRLLRRYFAGDREWLGRLDDPVERLAAGFGMVYKVLADQLARHPEWTLVYHEALCEDPRAVFHRLFEATRIQAGPRLDAFLERTTRTADEEPYSILRETAREPEKWKAQLDAAQIEAVASVIARFNLPFYRDFA